MPKNKLIDCITFFDNNFMFELRFNILKNFIDFFVVCESEYDHRNIKKKLNFDKSYLKSDKVKYLVLENPFPKETNLWENQAIQREFLLNGLKKSVMMMIIFFFQILMKFQILILFKISNLIKNMLFFYKSVLTINLIFSILTKVLGKEQEFVKK